MLSGSACWLCQSAWHMTDTSTFSTEQPLSLYFDGADSEKISKCKTILSRPKMADLPTPFCASLLCFGGRIQALFSIRGSWWKPYLQASVYVPLSEKQHPAYTGIARWNELSFWQKPKQIPGRVERFFCFLLSITCHNLRKPVSCSLGFHTLVRPLSDVCIIMYAFNFF